MFTYDEAVDYIESKGISADPTDAVGEFVCDLLDEYANEDDEYSSRIITRILAEARQYIEEYEAESDEDF